MIRKLMRSSFGWLLFATLIFLIGGIDAVRAAGSFTTAVAITCPASGTSIQLLPPAASRQSYLISNTAGATIRFGFLSSGTATLTDSNSIKLLAGQIFADSAPSGYIGRVVCMSDDATPDVVYVLETRRQ
jgi:hypothetical protein